MAKVVTANILTTGHVVFLGSNGAWVGSIDRALIYPDAEAADEGLAFAKRDAERAIVVDPFVTDKGPVTDGKAAMTLRDSIRAYGPTINFLPADTTAARG